MGIYLATQRQRYVGGKNLSSRCTLIRDFISMAWTAFKPLESIDIDGSERNRDSGRSSEDRGGDMEIKSTRQ